MIAVDTSAVWAVLNREPEAPRLLRAMAAADRLVMSSPVWVELGILIDRRFDLVRRRSADTAVSRLDLDVLPLTPRQAQIARETYRDFGKGSGHPAQLNLADTYSYALASDLTIPLLFVGEDFSQTDLQSALD